MYSPAENRKNAGTTSNDSPPDRRARSRTKVATREEMLGDAAPKTTQLRKLLDLVNALQKFDLVGVKKEYDSLMRKYGLGDMIDSEDRYFSPIKSPSKTNDTDDYYKNKYIQLQGKNEENELAYKMEIENLMVELGCKNNELEQIKAELEENIQRHDVSSDAKTIEDLRMQNDEMKRKNEETEKKFNETKDWIETMKTTIKASEAELHQLKRELAIYKKRDEENKKRLREEEKKSKAAEEARSEALTRLSKEMGSKLNDNNPAIADLSDPNRATKLAEMYSEIYDNEWTDALEELEKDKYSRRNEETCIRMLLDVVKKADDFCKRRAMDQMRIIEDSFFKQNTAYDNDNHKKVIMKMLKDRRKSTADNDTEGIYQEFSDQHNLRFGIQTEYVKKIVKLCWLMAIQDPPVCFGNEAISGEKLDIDNFKPYTQTGTSVSYTVWLPMFLHEGGPLLKKGVAQPFSTRAKSAPARRNPNDDMRFKPSTSIKNQAPVDQQIPNRRHAWESTLGDESNKYFNTSTRNYRQINDYQSASGISHKPAPDIASSSRGNSHVVSGNMNHFNRTYGMPTYEQSIANTHRTKYYNTYQDWKH